MQKFIYSFSAFLLLLNVTVHAQSNSLHVEGKDLVTPAGQHVVLRGVNYPLINEGSISLDNAAAYEAYIDEVANTGANAVRIPWYTDGQSWRDKPGPPDNGTPGTVNGYVTNGHLNNIIAYCISKKMIPILSIHDDDYITCKDNWNYFNTTVMSFWTDPAILSLIENNKGQMIINLANEFDYVRWGGTLSSELATFKNNYSAAITTLRQAGVSVPIMIDAPDCGQSSTELLSVSEEMNTNDPLHNLVFSAHAYWYGYANSLSAVQTKLNEAANTAVCFVLGEVAPNQDGSNQNECGLYDLSSLYPQILQEACSRNIGWLAWSFSLDCSSAREMSPTSSASNLTAFGNDIVNNSNYGLKSQNGCGAQLVNTNLGLNESNTYSFQIAPNPAHEAIQVNSALDGELSIQNMQGESIYSEMHKTVSVVSLSQFSAGIYFVTLKNKDQSVVQKLIIY